MKKLIILLVFASLQYVFAFSSDQKLKPGILNYQKTEINNPDSTEYNNPIDQEINRFFSFGCGLGIPYGLLGFKGSVILGQIGGSVGLGFVPLAWAPCISGSANLYFNNPAKKFRPKATVSFTNSAFAIAFVNSNLTSLYKKVYPGFGIYLGADYKFYKEKSLGFDFNIGYLKAFQSDTYLLDKYDEEKAKLESEGYSFGSEIKKVGHIKVSVGMVYYFPLK